MTFRLPIITMAAVIALAVPAVAQAVPEQATMDLWCGIAFVASAEAVPADATEADMEMVAVFETGGAELIEKSRAAHIEAGLTEEDFTTTRTELEPVVMEQIMGSGDNADFTFEQCSALIEMPEAM